MKILSTGKSSGEPWWVGHILCCRNCGWAAKLERGDEQVKYSRWLYDNTAKGPCPECGVLISLEAPWYKDPAIKRKSAFTVIYATCGTCRFVSIPDAISGHICGCSTSPKWRSSILPTDTCACHEHKKEKPLTATELREKKKQRDKRFKDATQYLEKKMSIPATCATCKHWGGCEMGPYGKRQCLTPLAEGETYASLTGWTKPGDSCSRYVYRRYEPLPKPEPEEKCSLCRFWKPVTLAEVRVELKDGVKETSHGYAGSHCERFPKHEPRNANDHCGEFIPKDRPCRPITWRRYGPISHDETILVWQKPPAWPPQGETVMAVCKSLFGKGSMFYRLLYLDGKKQWRYVLSGLEPESIVVDRWVILPKLSC